jgi:phospholipase C
MFTRRVRRSGLTPAVVLADAVVISALALAQQHLVPAVLIADSTTWGLPLACTSVYILQMGAGHPADAWLLVVDTIVAAGLQTERKIRAEQARRAAADSNAAIVAGADIKHVVILMQENRSFDHYFGTLRGVRGFGDKQILTYPDGSTIFHQPDPARADPGYLLPYHLTDQVDGDLDHS